METFNTTPGFCPSCGTILPQLSSMGGVECYNCKEHFEADVFSKQEIEYHIHFNNYDEGVLNAMNSNKSENEIAAGPVIDRKCPKCGHDKMSYATLQLRSADEGQTVFFTCLKCKHKEFENS